MDLMQEYYTWQNPERANQFSYCQYPFILSIVAKQHILTKDSEQQASLHLLGVPLTIRLSYLCYDIHNSSGKIEKKARAIFRHATCHFLPAPSLFAH